MIGPSSSGEEQALQPPAAKRRALEELDIESICEEVCGHNHHHHHHHHHYHGGGHRQQPAAKRPRYLLEPQPLDHQLADGAQAVYAPLEPHYQYEHLVYQQEDQPTEAAPVARLEVLVVDGTWDDALESFQAAAATTPNQSCASSFEELTSLAAEPNPHQPQPLPCLSFPDPYWSASQNPSPEQQQSTMPKVQSAETGRSSRGGFGAQLQQQQQQQPAYEDQENGNLSWLLDFKLDSFIEAPEDKCTLLLPRDLQANKCKPNGSGSSRTPTTTPTPAYSHESSLRKPCGPEQSGPRFEAPTYSLVDSRSNNRCAAAAGGPKKPPFTYTELIEHALQERGELTVSAIYQWISEHFPYYKSNDDRWKNSVRHNLSINPHFRKGSKAPHGAGHLWAIASQDESKPRQLFNIATIRQALKNEEANSSAKNNSRMTAIDEVAAATASIAQPAEEESIIDAITLEHCAEQILSGIKKEVEVQYLVPMIVSSNGEVLHNQCQQSGPPTDQHCPVKETDFLNPVSKEVVAEECGLIGEGYLVTDLNPSSLGLNMAESEVVTTDNLFGEELSFQFYEFASSSQLQSA